MKLFIKRDKTYHLVQKGCISSVPIIPYKDLLDSLFPQNLILYYSSSRMLTEAGDLQYV
jgi:hypothetical protein